MVGYFLYLPNCIQVIFYLFVDNILLEHNWDFRKDALIKKSQLHILRLTKELFPDTEIRNNYKSSSSLFTSIKPMEFDVYAPSLSLVLEYQGEQHFPQYMTTLWSDDEMPQRDKEKKEVLWTSSLTLTICRAARKWVLL